MESLNSVFNFLIRFHPDIKFTMTEPPSEGIEFLDTFVYLKSGVLHTKPYSKPCDNHQYLNPTSCHPTHTINNIPYSIAYRIFKICSEPSEYMKSKLEYSMYLGNRGYSKECINIAFDKVEKLDRMSLIYNNKSEKIDSTCYKYRNFPLVCDFNPDLPPIGKIVNKYKHLLELDVKTTEVIRPENVFVSYRGNRTIQEILVPSKLKVFDTVNNEVNLLPVQDLVGCFQCEKVCKLCRDFLVSPSHITSFHTEKKFNFSHKLNCKSKFVIYLVNDIVCKRTYTGSTETGMTERWRNHKSHIRKRVSSCEVSTHFKQDLNSHPFNRDSPLNVFDSELKKHITVTIIDQVTVNPSVEKLKEREAYWQSQLRTFATFGGFNKRDSRVEKTKKSYSSES